MARFFVVVSLVAIAAALPQGLFGGNGYSGATGPANGGEASNNGGLVNILSNNGGPGGSSSSGDVLGGNHLPKEYKKPHAPKTPCHDCATVQNVDNGLLDVIIGSDSVGTGSLDSTRRKSGLLGLKRHE